MSYHDGEILVQERASVREMAARIGRSIREEIPATAADFLLEQRMAILSATDPSGAVWASALAGEPGFLHAVDDRTIRIEGRPIAGDPLDGSWDEARDIGMLVMDFATRRRMRVNGRARADGDGLVVRTRQVYANCPKYIQARELEPAESSASPAPIHRAGSLTPEQIRAIESADTFFVASAHPEAGADALHRGGMPGFVRVRDAHTIVWPDYEGNTMFQTLGNIEATGRAGLLFLDFDTGSTLQITGTARIVWNGERAVELRVERTVETPAALPIRGGEIEFSPFNPTTNG